jgi:hypothetical protein
MGNIPSPRVVWFECQCQIAIGVEEGNITTRGIVVVELHAAVRDGLVVATTSSSEDSKVMAVEVDLLSEW